MYINTILTNKIGPWNHQLDQSFNNLLHHLPAIESISVVLGDERGDQERPQHHFVSGWGNIRRFTFPQNWNTFRAFKSAMAAQAQDLNQPLPQINLVGSPKRFLDREILDDEYPVEAFTHHQFHVRCDKIKLLRALRQLKTWEQTRDAELEKAIKFPRRRIYVRPALDDPSALTDSKEPVKRLHKFIRIFARTLGIKSARLAMERPPAIPCRCQLRTVIEYKYPIVEPGGEDCTVELRKLAGKWIRYTSDRDCW
jgi:hypothetical protein